MRSTVSIELRRKASARTWRCVGKARCAIPFHARHWATSMLEVLPSGAVGDSIKGNGATAPFFGFQKLHGRRSSHIHQRGDWGRNWTYLLPGRGRRSLVKRHRPLVDKEKDRPLYVVKAAGPSRSTLSSATRPPGCALSGKRRLLQSTSLARCPSFRRGLLLRCSMPGFLEISTSDWRITFDFLKKLQASSLRKLRYEGFQPL